ncbi:MAG: hypothetical protein IJB57_11015 [Clostridia bacterium]|nr:hypothetical protein [Clostridia bacterium]
MKFFGYNIEDPGSEQLLTLRETTIVTESIEEIDSLIEFLQFVKHDHFEESRKHQPLNTHTHYRDWTDKYQPNGDFIIVTDIKKRERPTDDISVEFTEKMTSEEYYKMGDPEKLKVILNYLDMAEGNPYIAMEAAEDIFYMLNLPDKLKKPHIMKACSIVLGYSNDAVLRRQARAMMADVCDDGELETLLKYCHPDEYNEAMEHRLFCKNENERAMEYHYATGIELAHDFLYHGISNNLSRDYRKALFKEKIRFFEYLGNGTVPDAWIENYAYLFVSLAQIETAEQNYDLAIEYLSRYLDINENKLSKIKEGDILRYGNEVFFGNFTRKAELLVEDGKPVMMTADIVRKENTRHNHPGLIFHPDSILYYFNDDSEFFALHGDERFESLKNRALKLTEEWIKSNSTEQTK